MPQLLYCQGKSPGTNWIGSWVESRDSLDILEGRKISPLLGFKHQSIQPIAKSQYCLCYPTFQRFVIVNVNLLIPLNIYALLLYKIRISSTMELWNISYIYRYCNGLTIIADRQCFRKGHTTNRPWLHHILMATNDSTGFVLSHKVPCSSLLTISLTSENQLK